MTKSGDYSVGRRLNFDVNAGEAVTEDAMEVGECSYESILLYLQIRDNVLWRFEIGG